MFYFNYCYYFYYVTIYLVFATLVASPKIDEGNHVRGNMNFIETVILSARYSNFQGHSITFILY